MINQHLEYLTLTCQLAANFHLDLCVASPSFSLAIGATFRFLGWSGAAKVTKSANCIDEISLLHCKVTNVSGYNFQQLSHIACLDCCHIG